MGSASNSSGYLYIDSSISKIGTNRYRMTITPRTSSSLVWNEYGINVYAYIGGSKNYVGSFTVSSGACSPSSFTYDFNVTSTVQVYAQGACSHCGGADDGWISTSTPDTATYINPNSPPPAPVVSCTTNPHNGKYYGENTLYVALTEVRDPDGDPVGYRIYGQYKVPGGSFVDWNSGDDLVAAERTANVDITRFARGTQFRFWGHAKDNKNGTWSGKSNVIENIFRNQAPSKPTLSCTNPQTNGKYVVEGSVSVSLSACSDPEGHSVSYKIYGQYYDGTWKNIGGGDGLVANGQQATIQLGSYARGTRFKFWGHSVDSLGAVSERSNEINNIYKNSINPVTGIRPSSGVITGNTIALAWNAVSDPDGQAVQYNIFLSKNGGQYSKLATQSQNSYNHNIASDPKGTKYQFKITATDGMAESEAAFSSIYRKDFAPVRIIPNATSTVFQNNPRIAFSKVKLSDVYMCVSVNSTNYTSKNNASLFRTKNVDVGGETVYVFTCTGLKPGANTITVYNSDGTFNSSSITFTINVESVSDSILGDIIKANSVSTIHSKSNVLRTSYGLGNISYETLTKNSTPIKIVHVIGVRTALDDVRNKINMYDSTAKTESWSSISKGSIIRKSDFSKLIASLGNI